MDTRTEKWALWLPRMQREQCEASDWKLTAEWQGQHVWQISRLCSWMIGAGCRCIMVLLCLRNQQMYIHSPGGGELLCCLSSHLSLGLGFWHIGGFDLLRHVYAHIKHHERVSEWIFAKRHKPIPPIKTPPAAPTQSCITLILLASLFKTRANACQFLFLSF